MKTKSSFRGRSTIHPKPTMPTSRSKIPMLTMTMTRATATKGSTDKKFAVNAGRKRQVPARVTDLRLAACEGDPGRHPHPPTMKEVNVKRIAWFLAAVVVAMSLCFGAGINAASKSYQFTGTVKASDAGTLTVQKS